MTALQATYLQGWAEVNSEGISTVYLSITDEGMVTNQTDLFPNTVYRPRVLNPENFSVAYTPSHWVWGGNSTQAAAYGQLEIDNYDGAFDFLIASDLRDSTVIIRLPVAGALLPNNAIQNAYVVATAIIDTVSCDDEDVVTIQLKDTIARLDKPLPCRFSPPFAAAAAANNMVPISLGACRNVAPLLLDTANRLFLLHDRAIANVAGVFDKAAPLDPNANPPQYTPALSMSGLQLQTMPVGKLTADVSSAGQQAAIPGIADVLAGAGAFPGSQGATTLAADWLGQRVYASTTSSAVTGSGPYTVSVASAAPANGTQVYISDGTNKLLGTIASGGGTTTITITHQDHAGTVTSITNPSPIVRTGAPTGFAWPAAGAISRLAAATAAFLGTNNAVQLTGTTDFNPLQSYYGDGFAIPNVLQPNSSYRVTFSLYNTSSANPYFVNGRPGGLVLATAQDSFPSSYITGIDNPITTAAFKAQRFVFEFTIPPGAANRSLYFIPAPPAGVSVGTPNGTITMALFDVKLELLGQYVALPLSAISVTDYYTEILVDRALEASTIFNSADTDACGVRSDGSLIPFGAHFDAPPNILDALRLPADTFGWALFTDNLGTLRLGQLIDPSNPDGRPAVIANFSTANVERPIAVNEDNATGLTTLMGARRNWSVFSDADFVTDQVIVDQDMKARYTRPSQYFCYSGKVPAGQYSFAVGATIFDSVMDLQSDAQNEIDRVVGIYSPQVYSDGTIGTGKRRLVKFTVYFDDPTLVGDTIQTSLANLIFGRIIQFNYPSHGFNNAYGMIAAWEVFPFAQKITLAVFI